MTKKKITAESLFELYSVTDPHLSPDGDEAVFIRTHMDKKENKYVSNLFHADLKSGKVTQWTHGKGRTGQPEWSEDGAKVAFLSDRDGKNQLFVMPAAGGEAEQVTEFANGVSSFVWSPCGKKIWVNGTVKQGKTFTDKEDEKKDDKQPEPVRVTKMKYKADGLGLLPQDQFRQIGSVDLKSKEVTQFTEGDHQHSLNAVSPDGKHIIFSVNRAENQDFEFRGTLYLADAETKKETVIIDEEGYYGGAAFSPDGQKITFIGADRRLENATHADVHVYDIGSGTRTVLTESLDAPVGDMAVGDFQQGANAPAVVWAGNASLYFQVSVMGDVRLYYATLEGELYPATPEDEHVYGYDISRDGKTAIIAVSDPVNPGELAVQDIASGSRNALTSFNGEFLGGHELVKPEPIVFKGPEERDVHGWILKPAGFEEGKKYPLITEIHGGPHAMYANTFFHELQLLAAQGYGVLYVNPRGSHGYSQEFVDAVRGDYGNGDYGDIMAGVDYALEHCDWVDPDRLGVTGGSYGGFMTNWIVGHTDRFKSAVTQRSIANWISFFGVSDIGYYFSEWQHRAAMDNVDALWDISPLKYAADVKTPLLILHSEKDFRCPIEQAEQLFITLRHMGKETEFVRFPEADHNLSRNGLPNLRIERLGEITGWFERYL
ncbi:S9 family peptidase [Edaphobacillus lindanitolerans]|uniref:Dipeptidyl aminopeptidase/acylaminoacyl peptidase n=1 Tax=Edaphobacillus lindanitolerans TaxID=550447 RepID=A0A1U7PQA8_9BACI|nr:S9 family peptidase [Edaphobacillus lindanitolerans]SIT91074.1 Dipeptidyl aminopeptidase/acylaminoacyl peptidase [Edaphobacillus lindanitolerans]